MTGYELILWDLDGTITDPKIGITRGVQHALAAFGIEVEDLDALTAYIGPPLRDAFADLHGITDPVDNERAVTAYREYYLDRGIFETSIVAGIPELLAALAGRDRLMAIATSKVDWMAERILERFGLRDRVRFVGGATLDGTRATKLEVIEHTLRSLHELGHRPARDTVVIVGDREHDVLAAHAAGIASIGVRWGYAEPGELEAAGPAAIVATVAALGEELSPA